MNAACATAGPPLLALDDAIERILARVAAPGAERAETVSTFDALGRVLAADVRSQIDVPPEDNSEMDGYALRAGDVAAPGTVLRVSQRIAAGSVGARARSRARRRGSSPARRCRPAPTRSSCRSSAASSTAACASMRPFAPASRSAAAARTSSAARVSSAPGSASSPQALGHGGVGRRRDACRSRAGRASRCSRPATSSRCRARRSSPARSTTRTASRCAA